ncbi:hypothetical protein D9M68_937580 [compost metagenome]
MEVMRVLGMMTGFFSGVETGVHSTLTILVMALDQGNGNKEALRKAMGPRRAAERSEGIGWGGVADGRPLPLGELVPVGRTTMAGTVA